VNGTMWDRLTMNQYHLLTVKRPGTEICDTNHGVLPACLSGGSSSPLLVRLILCVFPSYLMHFLSRGTNTVAVQR